MSDNTLVRQTARELARLIRTRAVSPIEVLDAHLAAIKALNPKLNAVVYEAYDEARAAADEKLPDGPFGGVPFLIKDMDLPVAGWPPMGWPKCVPSAFLKR